MFKNRKYLSGLGAGLIIGALLVQLANMGAAEERAGQAEPAASPVAPIQSAEPWTTESLQKEAARLDSVLVSAAVYAELQAAKSTSSAIAGKPLAEKEQQIYIYIYGGMDSSAIEEYLYQAGIIKDRVAFRLKIRKESLSVRLKAGLYAFTPGTDLDEVIAVLTGKKN